MQSYRECGTIIVSYLRFLGEERRTHLTGKREKRVDSNGERLNTNELQKKNGIYQYRYKDMATGKYRYETSPTLEGLRAKEKEVERARLNGAVYADGKITLIQQVERYISLKEGRREGTKETYAAYLNIIRRENFAERRLCDIKMSDVKMWYRRMERDGKARGTISALDDGVILRNPFDFRIDSVLSHNERKRTALSVAQAKQWLDFIRTDDIYSDHYDTFVILLYTGMRVSELCGLTLADLDFTSKTIDINKQLLRGNHGKYVQSPKTKAGTRIIAMLPEAYSSLQRLIKRRRNCKVEPLVDGHSGFLLLTKTGNPKTAQDIEAPMRRAYKRYCELHPNMSMPYITPHVFRHTFCTMMMRAGMPLSDIQRIMGHERASTTLDIYTHADNAQAVERMAHVYEFSGLKALGCAQA